MNRKQKKIIGYVMLAISLITLVLSPLAFRFYGQFVHYIGMTEGEVAVSQLFASIAGTVLWFASGAWLVSWVIKDN